MPEYVLHQTMHQVQGWPGVTASHLNGKTLGPVSGFTKMEKLVIHAIIWTTIPESNWQCWNAIKCNVKEKRQKAHVDHFISILTCIANDQKWL